MRFTESTLLMGFLGNLRRAVAYRLYTRPTPIGEEGGLSTRGIVDYALSTNEKRDVVRQMAYHMGTRKRYSPDGGGSYAINAVSRRAVRGGSLDVSTDPTDYDDMDEHFKTVREARDRHMQESVLPELVNSKVLEATAGYDNWVSDMDELDGDVTGIRPGPRFEFAVQALRWIDATGSQYDWTAH
jgi:hypothetical protein